MPAGCRRDARIAVALAASIVLAGCAGEAADTPGTQATLDPTPSPESATPTPAPRASPTPDPTPEAPTEAIDYDWHFIVGDPLAFSGGTGDHRWRFLVVAAPAIDLTWDVGEEACSLTWEIAWEPGEPSAGTVSAADAPPPAVHLEAAYRDAQLSVTSDCADWSLTTTPAADNRFTAPIEYAYFDVSGRTAAEVSASIVDHGPVMDDGTVAAGMASWAFDTSYEAYDGSPCQPVGPVSVSLPTTITLPRWTVPDDAPASATEWWDEYLAEIVEHELGHRAHGLQAAGRFVDAVDASGEYSTCDAFSAFLTDEMNALQTDRYWATTRFDKISRHGWAQTEPREGQSRARLSPEGLEAVCDAVVSAQVLYWAVPHDVEAIDGLSLTLAEAELQQIRLAVARVVPEDGGWADALEQMLRDADHGMALMRSGDAQAGLVSLQRAAGTGERVQLSHDLIGRYCGR